MSVAQQLYEGNFEIPGYSGGLITYMRTDSTTLSEESLQQAKQVILLNMGKSTLLTNLVALLPKPKVLKKLTKQFDPSI